MQSFKNDEYKVINLLDNLKEKLQGQINKQFTFLLIGRTGVGKSSTVNSLMGQKIAIVGDYEPTTIEVKNYEYEMNGIKFKVIDTPGLCDDLEEKGNDYKYLELIRSKVNQIDSMWFISRLDDTRVTTDEKRGIKLISEAFKPKIWEQAVIIFTFAGNVEASKYEFALEKRTELIRKEIAKYTGIGIANNIPALAVDNKSETTPDKEKWLGELYTQVYARMSIEGAIPFLMATVEQIKQPGKEKEVIKKPTHVKTRNPSITPTPSERIELNERQTKIVKNKTSNILEMAAAGATAGAAIGGSIAGQFGAAVGGVVGSVIGFVGGLFGL